MQTVVLLSFFSLVCVCCCYVAKAAASETCVDKVGNGMTCAEMPGVCSTAFASLVCRRFCQLCERCEDKIGNGLSCLELAQICAKPYGAIACPKSCGACEPDLNAVTSTPDSTSSVPFDSCVDKVVKGVTCADLQDVCSDYYGQILCGDYCGFCGTTTVSTMDHHSTLGLLNSAVTSASGTSVPSTLASTDAGTTALSKPPNIVGSSTSLPTSISSGSKPPTNITFNPTPSTNNNSSGSMVSSGLTSSGPSPSTAITFHPPTPLTIATSDANTSAFPTPGTRPNTLTPSQQSSNSSVVVSGMTTSAFSSSSQALHWSKCMDHIGRGQQCSSYAGFCTDAYATLLCPKFCGFCVPLWETGTFAPDTATSPATSDSCVDRVTNGLTCRDMPGLCNNEYGKQICPRTCNTCGYGTATATPSTSLTPTLLTAPITMSPPTTELVSLSSLIMNTATTTPYLTSTLSTQRPDDDCSDNVGLGMSCDGACNDPLASILCRKTCGFCACQDRIMGMTCQDLIEKYDRDPCRDPLGHQVCARFCGFC